ncbi:hypothetical protein NKH18_36165 [Streptomyces sp. M10(2022)]
MDLLHPSRPMKAWPSMETRTGRRPAAAPSNGRGGGGGGGGGGQYNTAATRAGWSYRAGDVQDGSPAPCRTA